MTAEQLARTLYSAFDKADAAAVLALFTEKIEWYEAEGHPYALPGGRPFVGGEEIVQKLFVPLGTEWENFSVVPASFSDAGSVAVVQGRYLGVFDGRPLDAQFCHVWTETEGLLSRFQQYTDTGQFQRVTKRGGTHEIGFS